MLHATSGDATPVGAVEKADSGLGLEETMEQAKGWSVIAAGSVEKCIVQRSNKRPWLGRRNASGGTTNQETWSTTHGTLRKNMQKMRCVT